MSELATVTTPERRLMPLRNVVEHASAAGRVIARVGTGTCPHCGYEGEAEAAGRLFCPNPTCAAPVLAVLPSGRQEQRAEEADRA